MNVQIPPSCVWLRIVSHNAGPWLQEHTDLRDTLNEQLDLEKLRSLTKELQRRIEDSGRTTPVPKLSDRALLRLEKERAKRQRIEEQLKEDGITVTPEVALDSANGGALQYRNSCFHQGSFVSDL